MIRLASLLKETLAEKKATSWLNPAGTFFPVDYSHGSDAYKYTGDVTDPMVILWKKGWQRVTYYSKQALYAHNEFMPPNDIQKRRLIELAQELDFPELTYDGGTETYVLWSIHDTL